MEVGMSLACFYPMEPERAVFEAAKLNIGVCEVFLNTVSELDEAYLHNLREECDRHHIRIHSVHPFTSFLENYMFFSPYPRRVSDAEAFYQRYADAAKILGAKIVNIHGDRGMGLENIENYVNCAAPLMRLQDKTGIIFSMENVFYNSVNHPEFAARLRQQMPEVRFTFDIKQAFKGGQDAYALVEAMGKSIVNFHVNDRDDTHICMMPGRGTVDFERIALLLKDAEYCGPALIEVYRGNFGDPSEMLDSKMYLEKKFMLAK